MLKWSLVGCCLALNVMLAEAGSGCVCSCKVGNEYRVVGSVESASCDNCDFDFCVKEFPKHCTPDQTSAPPPTCTDLYGTWAGVYNVLEGTCAPDANGDVMCVQGCDEKRCDCLVDTITIKYEGDKLLFSGTWQKADTTKHLPASGEFFRTGGVSATGNMTGIGVEYDALALTNIDVPSMMRTAAPGNITHSASPYIRLQNPTRADHTCDVIAQLNVKGKTNWLVIGLAAGGGVVIGAVLFYCFCCSSKKTETGAINQTGYERI